jgi:hypothetical protein
MLDLLRQPNLGLYAPRSTNSPVVLRRVSDAKTLPSLEDRARRPNERGAL